jgi:hypothetical protein
MPEMDRRLKRIRALLDRAQRVDTAPEEADAARQKAMQLMVEHGIDRAMVDAAAGDQAIDGMDTVTITMHAPYTYEKAELATAIGFVFGCDSTTRGWRGRHAIASATLYGHRSDLERTQLLYTSLLVQATSEMTRTPEPPGVPRVSFLRDFLYGFTASVVTRLKAMQDQAVQEYEQQHSTETGADNLPISVLPVLATRRERVRTFFKEQTGDLPEAAPVERTGIGIYAGHIAGQRADLGDGSATVAAGSVRQGTLTLAAPASVLPGWLTRDHWSALADVAAQGALPAAAEMGASAGFLHDVLQAVIGYCRSHGAEHSDWAPLVRAVREHARTVVAGDHGKINELAFAVLSEVHDRIQLWESRRVS